ncbi:restriction endonuclease subunit S [Comamonas jiangduensis]|uniref:restriction endonuclease subunit S n=1 Tax=Comamonas jiangduensis TaxID=1194168 RepID=UPI003BF87DB3
MSFPRYPEYKDSGVEWLGKVPEHWTVTAIKRVCTVVGGSTPKSDQEAYWDGDITWVTPADLSRLTGFEIHDSMRTITAEGLASCGTTIVPEGSVILSTRAPIGSLGIAAKALCTNQGCKALVPNGPNPRLLAYLLTASNEALNVRGKGTTFLELSGDELGAFVVPLASVPEQTAIATFLDHETAKIDALVAEQEKLINLLQEKRQAVISHAVTKGLNPNIPMKDSGVEWLGEVPEHWEVIPAKRVASIFVPQRNKPDLNADGDGHFWVTMEQMHSEEINSAELTVTEVAARDAGTRILPAGAVVASCVGSFGLAAINSVDVIINQQLQAFIPNNHVDARFLRHCVVIAKCYFEQIGTAATIAYVNQLGFANMPMPLPPEEEQHQIVAFLAVESVKFDTLMAEARTAITLLQERRTALISAAVTGQIDVRGLVGGVNTPD